MHFPRGSLWTNFSDVWIKVQHLSWNKINLKMSWWALFLGLNMLSHELFTLTISEHGSFVLLAACAENLLCIKACEKERCSRYFYHHKATLYYNHTLYSSLWSILLVVEKYISKHDILPTCVYITPGGVTLRYHSLNVSESFTLCTIIKMTSLWVRWRLKSSASRLFTQLFIQTQIKEYIKAPRHWPLCGEFTGDRWIPRTNGQ